MVSRLRPQWIGRVKSHQNLHLAFRRHVKIDKLSLNVLLEAELQHKVGQEEIVIVNGAWKLEFLKPSSNVVEEEEKGGRRKRQSGLKYLKFRNRNFGKLKGTWLGEDIPTWMHKPALVEANVNSEPAALSLYFFFLLMNLSAPPSEIKAYRINK